MQAKGNRVGQKARPPRQNAGGGLQAVTVEGRQTMRTRPASAGARAGGEGEKGVVVSTDGNGACGAGRETTY
jgi:hypothetical protein